jgi:hypothetical protein
MDKADRSFPTELNPTMGPEKHRGGKPDDPGGIPGKLPKK